MESGIATELQSLDLTRLLQVHTIVSLASSLSIAPTWNFPLFLYGLVVVGRSDSEASGDSVRQFTALLGASFVLDILWLLSSWRDGTTWSGLMLIIGSFSLKPVTLLAALGHLRQRNQPTFSFPASLSSGGNGFPPAQAGQPVWQAPVQSSYHQQGFTDDEEATTPQPPVNRGVGNGGTAKAAPAPARTSPSGAEGGGYHTLE